MNLNLNIESLKRAYHGARLTISSVVKDLYIKLGRIASPLLRFAKYIGNRIVHYTQCSVRFIANLRKAILIPLFLFLVVFLYEAFFTGDIRYYFKPQVQNDDIAMTMLREAATMADVTNISLDYFTDLFINTSYDTTTLRESLDGKSIIDFLEASADINFDINGGSAKTEIKLKIIGLYDSIVSSVLTRIGLRKAIVVETFTVDSANNRYKINLYMYPDSSAAIPLVGTLDQESFVGNLSHSVGKYRTTYSKECNMRMCFSDFPKKPEAMKLLLKGIDIVQKLKGSQYCSNQSDSDCAEEASNILRESIKMDEEQTLAQFGVFLSELYIASDLVTTSEAKKTADAIFRAARHLEIALANSASLKNAMSDKGTIDKILSEDKYKELDLTTSFLSSMSKYEEANTLYKEQKYSESIGLYKDIQDVAPKWLKGLLALRLLYGEMRVNGGKTTSFMIEKLDALRPTINNNVYYYSMKAQFLVAKIDRDDDDLIEALTFYDNALADISIGVPRHALIMQRASVKHLLGDTEGANDDAVAIGNILSESSVVCDSRYATVHLAMAEYYDHAGNIDNVKRYLEFASLSDRNYFNTNTSFNTLSEYPGLEAWRSAVSEKHLRIDEGKDTCENIWKSI